MLVSAETAILIIIFSIVALILLWVTDHVGNQNDDRDY